MRVDDDNWTRPTNLRNKPDEMREVLEVTEAEVQVLEEVESVHVIHPLGISLTISRNKFSRADNQGRI